MTIDISPQLDQMSISESSWTVIPGEEKHTHENGNCESETSSSETSPSPSVVESANSSFSSISYPEMSLPKSIVKKRRVGSNADESYGQITFEDNASEGAITDTETEDYAAPKGEEDSFADFAGFDGDDESSEKESDDESDQDSDEDEESDDEGSDDDWISESYEEVDEPCTNMSFISFSEEVSFNMTVSYAEPPVYDSDSDSESDSDDDIDMTFHERMVRALARSKSYIPSIEGNASLGKPEEHSHDDLDVDKRLLAAYVNGIRASNEMYKRDLASLALNINQGLTSTPFFSNDNVDGFYLNHALKHVIGIFRNLVNLEELEILLDDAVHKDNTFKSPFVRCHSPTESATEKSTLHEDVCHLLSERLIDETMPVDQDVIDFFTRGVIYSLKKWASEDL